MKTGNSSKLQAIPLSKKPTVNRLSFDLPWITLRVLSTDPIIYNHCMGGNIWKHSLGQGTQLTKRDFTIRLHDLRINGVAGDPELLFKASKLLKVTSSSE
tara:strand:+ start:79 stop:378 length:300 start_codon:yes stop_codon:yes gene_type:complete